MRGSSRRVAVGALAGSEGSVVVVRTRSDRSRAGTRIRSVPGAGWQPATQGDPLASPGEGVAEGDVAPGPASRNDLGCGRLLPYECSGTRAVGSADRRDDAAALSSYGMIRAPSRRNPIGRGGRGPGSEGKVVPVRAAVVGKGGGSPAMHSVWKGGDKPLHPL
jgi:hypothetical protein